MKDLGASLVDQWAGSPGVDSLTWGRGAEKSRGHGIYTLLNLCKPPLPASASNPRRPPSTPVVQEEAASIMASSALPVSLQSQLSSRAQAVSRLKALSANLSLSVPTPTVLACDRDWADSG